MDDQSLSGLLTTVIERLGQLLNHGVPLVRAIDAVCSDYPAHGGSLEIQELNVILQTFKLDIERGKMLAESIRVLGIFTDSAVEAVLAGERTGKLDQSLIQIAQSIRQGEAVLTGNELPTQLLEVESQRKDRDLLQARFNELLTRAVQARASDLHLDPERGGGSRLRLRIDGVLHYESELFTVEQHTGLVSLIKKMADLDVGERRRPQDGRIMMTIPRAPGGEAEPIDFRVSICPYVHGEKVVIRFLDCQSFPSDFEYIGLPPDRIATLDQWLKVPFGLILVTGPTGSGKTTTLYLMLSRLARSGNNNILSIEDPVEYILPGIQQMQIQPSIGLTVSAGLRSMLRQDPDIICIGEIPDSETARLAIQVALTGHLVLTQLHASDAVSAIKLMNDLGLPAFKLRESITGVISQRLIRKLCPHCKHPLKQEEIELLPDYLRELDCVHYSATGCSKCHNAGYRGRAVVMELLAPDTIFWKALDRGAEADELRALLPAKHASMLEHGIRLIRDGITSAAELARVIG